MTRARVSLMAVAMLLLGALPAHAQVLNPYNPGLPGIPGNTNPYVPGFPGYGGYPGAYYAPIYGEAGGLLFGQADLLRAYGVAITSQEQARLMRQQAIQARFDTQRKKFELEMYIKANTPTFTEEQAKIGERKR